MTDIFDGLARIRHEFLGANMKPPIAILLESHDEGMRFLDALRQTSEWQAVVGSPSLGKFLKMPDGSAWMEIEIMGMNIRWPAERIATPDGSWGRVYI